MEFKKRKNENIKFIRKLNKERVKNYSKNSDRLNLRVWVRERERERDD